MIGSFARNVEARGFLTLFSGNLAVQIISLAFYPLIARIYDPTEFGLFATMMVVALIGNILSAGQLHFKLPTLRTREDINAYGKTAIFSTLFILTINLLLVLVIYLLDIFQKYHSWLYLLPFLIALLACNDIIKSYNLALKKFKINAWLSFAQRVGANIAKVFAKAPFGSVGLIWGEFLGACLGSLFFFRTDLRKQKLSLTRYKEIFFRELPFQLTQTSSTLLNQFYLDLPVLALAIRTNSKTVGLFAMSYKLVGQPLVLIGNALSGAIFRKITEIQIGGQSSFNYIKRLLLVLVTVFIPATVIAYITVAPIISWLLGEDWAQTAAFAQAFTLLIFFKILSSLLNVFFVSFEDEKILLIKKITLVIGALLIFGVLDFNPLALTYLYVIFDILVITSFTCICMVRIRERDKTHEWTC